MDDHDHLTLDDVFWVALHTEEPGLWQTEFPRLLLGCPGCRANCEGLLEVLDSGELPKNLNFHDLHRAYSAHQAERVWASIKSIGPDLLPYRLQREPATYGLVARLAEESHEQASVDIDRALLLGKVAVQMASRLLVFPERPEEGFDHRCLDVEARAELLGLSHGVLANAYRKHYRYGEAEEHFIKALEFLAEASRAPTVYLGQARVLSMKASLRMDIRRLEEAIDCLVDARAAIRGSHSDGEAAEIAIKLSIALGLANRHDEALTVLRATQGKEAHLSARLRFALAHRVVEQAVWCGDPVAARAEFPLVVELHKTGGRGLDALRVEWLEGRIQGAEGDLERALGVFQGLQDRFLAEGLLHEAASLALEVASVLLALDRPQETAKHAREAFAIFVPLQVKDEVLGALTLLVQAANRGKLTQVYVAALLRYARSGIPPEQVPW